MSSEEDNCDAWIHQHGLSKKSDATANIKSATTPPVSSMPDTRKDYNISYDEDNYETWVRNLHTIKQPNTTEKPIVSVVMGSQSDWPTMQKARDILSQFNIPHECRIISAHRTPQRLYEFPDDAKRRGIRVIIAGAGGSAHLPGMLAACGTLPVLGVPMATHNLHGLDSLYSIVQMPRGVPVATFAIGEAGAVNAALFAVQILSIDDSQLHAKFRAWRQKQTESVEEFPTDTA